MITMKELNPKGVPLSDTQSSNLKVLYDKMNLIRRAFGRPMFVTSSVRSIEDHRRIYEQKARRQGLKSVRVPMGSKHLSGQAVDILDASGELKAWIKRNVEVLEEVGLWCEDFSATPTWVHFQSVPPGSRKRFFKP